MIQVFYPENNAVVSLISDVQREFMYKQFNNVYTDSEKSYDWIVEKYGKDFVGYYVDNPESINLTQPRYVEFAWRSDKPCKIEIYREKSNFPGDPEEWEILPVEEKHGLCTCLVGNLFMRTRYYWKVVSLDGEEESPTFTFITANEYPRAIYAQGASNIRDIGALERYDGTRLRQGCIYRGTCLESIIDREYQLTQRGICALRDKLKIKSDVDLRKEVYGKLTESALGDAVNYVQLIGRGYELFYAQENLHYCKALIEFLADENNYPAYVHCMGGADRTGTLFFFLGMLLGVKFEYLVADYNITTLTVLGRRYTPMSMAENDYAYFWAGPDFDGDHAPTVMKNAKRFLVEKCGVSEETVERLKRNLIENYDPSETL